MKPRAFVTRFARIISTSRLPDKYKISTERLKDIDPQSVGPATRKFCTEVLSIGLSCQHELGNLLIYPLRIANVYILSINGKSEIFSSNQRLYKMLCKKGFITASTDTQALFREYATLDFSEISRCISNSQIKQIPVDDCFISDRDIFFLNASNKTNHFAFIPCWFEDKTVIEAFFETTSITGKLLEEFDQHKLKQITSAFNEPSEIIQEIAERLNL